MPSKRDKRRERAGGAVLPVESLRHWRLGQARNQFSEMVRLAALEGPQLVMIHEREAAIVMTPEDYRALGSTPKNDAPLVEFFEGLGLADRSVHRASGETEREMEL